VGEPIPTSGLTLHDLDAVSAKVHAAMAALLEVSPRGAT
jgi:hypothetical protein